MYMNSLNAERNPKTVLLKKTDKTEMSRDMKFPTMWYVRPAKPQISLRMRAV